MDRIDLSNHSDVSLEEAEYDSSSESEYDTALMNKIDFPVIDVKNPRKTGPILYALFYVMGAIIILTSSSVGYIKNTVFHVFGIENNSYSSGTCFGRESGCLADNEEEDCYKYDDVV